MSDTENKTEKTAETTDTAPYMKKDKQNKDDTTSAKSNIVIPLVLLLVSAIVIIATFYEEEYSDLMAQTEAQDNAVSKVNTEVTAEAIPETASEVVAETAGNDSNATQDRPALNVKTTTEKAGAVAQIEATEQNSVTEAKSAPPAVVKEEVVAVVAAQARPVNNNARPQQPYAAPYQYNAYNRDQAKVMAKQRMEMLQQRRQAYEKEMQDRRTQYEAAMQARQEKRKNIAEAQKAVFQRAQQDRVETNQKIQDIHNKISKLHEEIHQLMQQSKKPAAPVPMHSM